MIKNIKSNRKFQNWPSWDIIHEWEDILSEHFNAKIYKGDIILNILMLIPVKKIRIKLCDNYIFSRKLNKETVSFHMVPLKSAALVPENDVPIVLDVWGDVNIDIINKAYSKSKIVYLTSLEVLNFLKGKVNFVMKHFPVTLPDQYYLGSAKTQENQELIARKDIDILQIGRGNDVLDKWVKQYLIDYPETHYVYQELIGDKIFMKSNQFGILSERKNRADYFDLLRRAKVSPYSSAGIDAGFERTSGFNALTPRLLECMSQFNYVIARYADNEEYAPVKDFIINCDTYEIFRSNLNRYLTKGDDDFFAKTDEFLKKNLTSSWFKILE